MSFNCIYAYLMSGEFGFRTCANARTSGSTLSSLPGYECNMLDGGGYGSKSTTVLFDRRAGLLPHDGVMFSNLEAHMEHRVCSFQSYACRSTVASSIHPSCVNFVVAWSDTDRGTGRPSAQYTDGLTALGFDRIFHTRVTVNGAVAERRQHPTSLRKYLVVGLAPSIRGG